MVKAPFPEAADYFTGRLNPQIGARVQMIRELLAAVLGKVEMPGDPEPPPLPRAPFRRLAMTSLHRTAAETTARAVTDALLGRRFDALAPLLHNGVRVLWPDGRFRAHAREGLLEALAASEGAPQPGAASSVRTYAPAELRGVTPRGVTGAIDATFEANDWIAVALSVAGPRSAVRVMVVTSRDEQERWRADSLLLPAGDEAANTGAAASADEEESLRVADRIVRHLILGHGAQLRTLRNQMVARLFVDDEIVEAEALAELAATGPHRLDALDWVFLGTEDADLESLDRHAPGRVDRLRRRSQEAWQRNLERQRLRVAVTRIGKLALPPGSVTPEREVSCLLLGSEDRGVLRWRLGGVFGAGGR